MESSYLAVTVSQPPNFHNLTLFICHLFINGHFRTSHIMYDSTMFDGQFMTQTNSIFPQSIRWKFTDISAPSLNPFGDPFDSYDNILQLIFFDPQFFGGLQRLSRILTNFCVLFN